MTWRCRSDAGVNWVILHILSCCQHGRVDSHATVVCLPSRRRLRRRVLVARFERLLR